ncbi:4-amino-4-deoxy-L-arabinose transferase-like glycosyltransferase [Clostridium pascui]|uniref:ArnT family glycosyltransferase n=1 Tax=Clostridium pascui TaxID=46609 RepID=UPI00195A3338|nr:glycosyltransferase family 39 protein [Clostridium pascui]MBM7868764.1 4-amino-4-deoxy-L-arabinose transferase-like glycosyltransferase [Clostridium pascui]
MFSIKNEGKWVKTSLIIIIALFFIVNLYATLRYGTENYLGSFEKFDNDDIKYIRSAWELADKGHLIYHRVDEPTVFIMPGLPYVLAFFIKIFGKFGGITAFRVFQALLQAASMYLIFLLGRKVFNSRAAILGCFLNSLYIAEYYTSTVILTEILFKFLLLLLIYVSIYAIEEKSLLYYTIGGIIWGFGCLVRPTLAAYPGIVLIIWIIKKYTLKDMVKFTMVTTLAFSTIMSPWWIRNYVVFRRFIPLTLSSGNPFLQGTYVNYDQSDNYTPYEPGKTAIESNQREIDAGLYRLKNYAVKEPLKYAYWYTIGKSWNLWNAPFYWKEILGVSFYNAIIFHYLILILGAAQSIRLFIKRNEDFLFLFITALFFDLIYIPYFTMSRYSYPIMPMVFIVAGYGIYEFIIRRLGFGKAANSNC